ncbi:hypothetical protein [Nocardia transvalensis]|uniref:hypothetical protein n=1 Tax=Nocardia transvalensis TaxID=37333 RepID=UPI0018933C82|nr:hypothetical protein [Nocardia transvalensis]MBF6332383.1 hypothetical protein [Nocardia transvalensis]
MSTTDTAEVGDTVASTDTASGAEPEHDSTSSTATTLQIEDSAGEPATVAPESESEPAQQVFPAEYVRQLRAEAARHRKQWQAAVTESEQAARRAAEDAAARTREEIASTLGKALGLVPDEVPADPAELLAQATAKAEQAQALSDQRATEARAARVELALYRAADAAGADATTLLDSRSFLATVADLDPSAAEFDDHITTAVERALADNPKFRKQSAPAVRSGGDLSAGPAGAPAVGDDTTVDALRKLRADRRARR